MSMTWLTVLVVVALAIVLVVLFNGLVRARNQVEAAWADVDVQLQRRHDLVPQLVNAVKAYMSHEKDTLTEVVAQRDGAVKAQSVGEISAFETQLEKSMQTLIARVEDYPDLKATDNFRQLTDDLVDIEDHLQHARRYYNGAVRDLNNRVERVPDRFIAGPLGFECAEFFQAEAGSRGPVHVGALS